MLDDQTLTVAPLLFHATRYKLRVGGDTKLVHEII
jgi:hypothetical protein